MPACVVTVEAYSDQRVARVLVDLGAWRSSPGHVMRSTLYELAACLRVDDLDAWVAHGDRVGVFGGKVCGGPGDGATWERDRDYWRVPVASSALTSSSFDAPADCPSIRTANYRWLPTGWQWDGYRV